MKKTFTDIEGVYASGTHCGIKPDKKDLAFVYVPHAVSSAGVFTQNKFAAACIPYTRNCLDKNTLKAVVINSGNANAVTGKEGIENNKTIAQLAAYYLKLDASQVGVASTGVIGKQLPIDKIKTGLKAMLSKPCVKEAGLASEAILTTDTCAKNVFLEKTIAGKKVIIAGMTKGAGMIAPNMATTLSFLVTNVQISSQLLHQYLHEAVKDTFNMISIDTDTSTNDMILIFATGEEHAKISSKSEQVLFKNLLKEACENLSQQIVLDGEGATKLIESIIEGAVSEKEARKIALNIVESPLVKTSIYGQDPNWGRILMAIGKDPSVKVNPGIIDLYIGDTQILSKGDIINYDYQRIKKYLADKKIQIKCNLYLGKAKAIAWGCDLSEKYITLNTGYS